MMAPLRAFVLHAERLHVAPVWRRTSALLSRLERYEARATLFVHPYEAIEAGVDIGPRIRELLARGHEIAQHTHFYEERDSGTSGKPRTDLDPRNIGRCLDRDLANLRAMGADPNGFTSGGWAVQPTVETWLADNGFGYDCSFRSFELGYENPAADAGGGYDAPALSGGIQIGRAHV